MNNKTDVVIVTLLRKTLPIVIKRINKIIPDNNIILITDKNHNIGDLRNIGLKKVTSDVCAFVDDDVLITKEWFNKCQQVLEEGSIACSLDFTICMLCKTKELKSIGGFPSFDSHIFLNPKIQLLKENFGVTHQIENKDLLPHTFKWLMHGFSKETPFGHNNGIKSSLKISFNYLISKKPLLSIPYWFWLTKALFIKIFKTLGYNDTRTFDKNRGLSL